MFLDVLFLYLVFSSILIFSEINARMYLSKKISIFNILECFCFPVVYVLVFLSVIIKIYRFLSYFFKTYFYVYRAQRFLLNTHNLNDEQLKNYILSNCLEKHSMDIKFIE
jgi:hypothetical protein